MTPAPAEIRAFARRLSLGSGDLAVAVKDCIDIAGEVTACGSAALRDAPPASANAVCVDTLLAHGCRIVGKSNMHELAYGMTGINDAFGTPINPRWPDRIPGGSSSGSAVAVAAGLCDFSVGTDTGGSVRMPAMCCGVYGIKPTFGRISRVGCHPAQSSLDSVGVFARTAPMLTRAMQAIDPSFQPTTITQAPRLTRLKAELDKSVGDYLIYGLMEGLPVSGYAEVDLMEPAFAAAMTIIGAETASAFGHLLAAQPPIGDDVRARIIAAQAISPDDVAKAETTRATFTAAVDALLEDADALITPALPAVPPTLAEARDPKAVLSLTRFLRPFNLSGHPALVLPVSAGPEALPMGLQIIGRKGDDARLCAIAEWMAHTFPMFHQEDTPQ